MRRRGVLAVDVGSSRVKFGWFGGDADCPGPRGEAESPGELPIASTPLRIPDAALSVFHRGEPSARWALEMADWLAQIPREHDALCLVAAVHPSVAAASAERLVALGWPQPVMLTYKDLPIVIDVSEPQRVGIDRLLGAVAVNRIRRRDEPAIVIDMGTAITVDLVDRNGRFSGGAILPGAALGASALHLGTASLPVVSVEETPQRCIGKSTSEAIAAGLHWGTLGAVVETARQIVDEIGGDGQFYLTGGDAVRIVEALGQKLPRTPRHLPSLILSGIDEVARTELMR